jgi:uncharacterized membrane protein
MLTYSLNQKLESVDTVRVGQYIFGIALIAFGIQHILFEDFITGRAPVWPQSVPGKLSWAYFSGLTFIATGGLIIFSEKARGMAFLAAGLILIWSVLRHIPVIASAESLWGAELTQLGKAITLFGGCLTIAGVSPKVNLGSSPGLNRILNSTIPLILVGRICLSFFLINSGIQHFLFAEFVKFLVPTWIPFPAFWTYFTGIALILGGIGLLIGKTYRLAAKMIGLMVFTWFLILHIPRAITMNDSNEWIAVFEALSVAGIAFLLTGKERQ